MLDRSFDPWRKRIGPPILGLILSLTLATLLLRTQRPATNPLPLANRLVVLLVPGASLADWQEREDMPTLAACVSGDSAGSDSGSDSRGFLGVFPNRLPWRVGDAKLTTLHPAAYADFLRASRSLGGERVRNALRGAGVTGAALNNDPAARAFLGDGGLPSPSAANGFVTDPLQLASAIRREAAKSINRPLLLAAAFDDLLRSDAYAPHARSAATSAQRRAALRRLDTLFSQLTGTGPNALPKDTALLILAPVPSMAAAERGEMLGPVLLWRRSAPPTAPGFLLTSPSTRQTPGLLAPGDLAATILYLAKASEKSVGGRSAVVLETAAPSAAEAEKLAARVAGWAAQGREIRLIISVPWLLAGTLLFAACFARGKVRFACVVGAVALPLALLLAAPFASEEPGKEAIIYATAGLMAFAVALISAVWARGRAEGDALPPPQAICLATALVIVLDTAAGGALLARSPLSYSPIAAARFYGIGNEISGVFLGASVLAVGVFCARPLGAALGGAIVALIVGAPMFGADAGGFIAALVGFGTLFVLLTAAQSENKRRAGLRAGVGVGVAVLLMLGLYIAGNGRQSAGTRTHVGEAVASAQNQGGARALLPLVRRKAATGVRLLLTSPWSILLITEAGLCFWLWRRRSPRHAAGRAVYQAAFVTAGTLLLVNDSGVVAAATCLLYPASGLLLANTEPPLALPPGAD